MMYRFLAPVLSAQFITAATCSVSRAPTPPSYLSVIANSPRTRTHTHAHARTRTHTHAHARTRTHTHDADADAHASPFPLLRFCHMFYSPTRPIHAQFFMTHSILLTICYMLHAHETMNTLSLPRSHAACPKFACTIACAVIFTLGTFSLQNQCEVRRYRI